jgi:hypothetical protein
MPMKRRFAALAAMAAGDGVGGTGGGVSRAEADGCFAAWGWATCNPSSQRRDLGHPLKPLMPVGRFTLLPVSQCGDAFRRAESGHFR